MLGFTYDQLKERIIKDIEKCRNRNHHFYSLSTRVIPDLTADHEFNKECHRIIVETFVKNVLNGSIKSYDLLDVLYFSNAYESDTSKMNELQEIMLGVCQGDVIPNKHPYIVNLYDVNKSRNQDAKAVCEGCYIEVKALRYAKTKNKNVADADDINDVIFKEIQELSNHLKAEEAHINYIKLTDDIIRLLDNSVYRTKALQDIHEQMVAKITNVDLYFNGMGNVDAARSFLRSLKLKV
jgi:hypothetical protein